MHSILLLLCVGLLALTPSATFSTQDPVPVRVTVHTQEKVAPISPLFWGGNFLYWVEDDLSLASGRLAEQLRDLPIRLLRFPGGTVADNYHWETNTLDNPFMFPYEEGPAQSDFDEFMAFCAQVGAEPLLVVNTQSWFLRGDIAGGAAEAAAWVRYCKERGYRVKYWEIGNETYWHTAMTAQEYGRLAKVYARAMKAVDPSILVGVNGGWDIAMTGNKERTDPALWEELQQDCLHISSLEENKAFSDKEEGAVQKPWTLGDKKWWDQLLSACGDQIDMLSVHWYFHDNVIKHIDKKLLELKDFCKAKQPHKDYLLCLSEFNCNTEAPELRMLGFAEGVGRFLRAGTPLSCFWPLRIGGKSHRSMFTLEDKEARYPYQIFSLFQSRLQGDMVACTSPKDLYAFASVSPDRTTVVLSGRSLKAPTQVVLQVEGLPRFDLTALVYTPNPKSLLFTYEALYCRPTAEGLVLDLAPGSFVLLTLTHP